MKDKIILFDIDETLFDPESFLNDFYKNLTSNFSLKTKEIKKIQDIYKDIKKGKGYFSPEDFLNKISNNFSQINEDSLSKLFWNIDLFNKNVYKDASVIKDLSRTANLGIFSKGDEYFQKQKITFISDVIDIDDIYIFKNKLEKISEVLENYKEQEIYLIDNELEILEKVKKLNPEVYTILIDRNNKYGNLDMVKIKDLTQLKSLIYD